MFGVGHCVFAQCQMQGSGRLIEDYNQPQFLCPVDLHKLAYSLSVNLPNDNSLLRGQRAVIDLTKRYQQMLEIFEKLDAKKEIAWLKRRLNNDDDNDDNNNNNCKQQTSLKRKFQSPLNDKTNNNDNDNDIYVPIIDKMSDRAKRALKRRILKSYEKPK